MSQPATAYEAFVATATRFPDRPFLCVLPETAQVYGIADGEISFGEMQAWVERLAAAWRAAGWGHGHRVGTLLENRPAFIAHWLALNAIGASVVPINPDYRLGEITYLVGHSEIAGAVVIPARQADIAEAAQAAGCTVAILGPDDPIPPCHTSLPGPAADSDTIGIETECGLLYTSGTTGRPKGCILTNRYYLNCGRWYLEVGGRVVLRPGAERMLTPLPLFHMNAMATSTMAMVMAGGCLIVLDRFHPRTWWQNVRDSRCTIFHYLGVMPPILMAAPESPADCDHSVVFGFGAGIDRRLHAPFEARFGVPLIEGWAMTETGGAIVISDNFEPRRVGTSCMGRPDAVSEVRIVRDDGSEAGVDEPGELLVRRAGANPREGFFKAYLKEPEATEAAWAGGWFHTGDVVRRDAEGYHYFVDRKKNVIRRSGENIAAVEVESVLLQHPAVKAAGVAAVTDDLRGEEVFACLVTREPVPADPAARWTLAEDITRFCLARLAYYKAPGFVAFLDQLPLTSTQKIQRGGLKDLVAGRVDAPDTIDLRALKKRTT